MNNQNKKRNNFVVIDIPNNAKSNTSENITSENIARMYGDRPMNENVKRKYNNVIEQLKGKKGEKKEGEEELADLEEAAKPSND